MVLGTKPRKLSVIIPPTPVSMQTATETTVDGSNLYSQFTQQAYRSPVSPLKHPYRPRERIDPEPPAKHVDQTLGLKAEDIASPGLLAVANLFVSMKETLNGMTRAFDALGGQSQRLSSLAGEVKLADDIRNTKAELEEQIARQEMKMQELRERLGSEVRIALENKLRERLTSIIQESIADEIEDRVCQELAVQIPQKLHDGLGIEQESQTEYSAMHQEEGYQSDPDTPLFSPAEGPNVLLKIPILLFQEPTDDEADCLEIQEQNFPPKINTPALFSSNGHAYYSPVGIPTPLFGEAREHEPPPPSPAPMAGPLRPLLRPLPTPEQSPAYVVYNMLPSRAASGCATPVTAYPKVPAPTPITNEPIIMVLPIKSAPVSALSPGLTPSPLAPRDSNLLFALSSEQNRELLRNHDLDGFVVPTPMAEWPKARIIVKTPTRSLRASPLMIPPPLEPIFVNMERSNHTVSESVPTSPAQVTPVLFVPPPRLEPRAGNSFADNLKLLPPLIIT